MMIAFVVGGSVEVHTALAKPVYVQLALLTEQLAPETTRAGEHPIGVSPPCSSPANVTQVLMSR
jgi:hypothetical protein